MKKRHVLLGLAIWACTISPASAWWWCRDDGFTNRSRTSTSTSTSTTTSTTIVCRPYNAFSDMTCNAICQNRTTGSHINGVGGTTVIPLSLLGLDGTWGGLPRVEPNVCIAPVYGYPQAYVLHPQPYTLQPVIPYPDYGYYPAAYYPAVAWYPPPPIPPPPPQKGPAPQGR